MSFKESIKIVLNNVWCTWKLESFTLAAGVCVSGNINNISIVLNPWEEKTFSIILSISLLRVIDIPWIYQISILNDYKNILSIFYET